MIFLRTSTQLKKINKKQLVLFQEYRKKEYYSENYIRRVISTLRTFFSHLIHVKKIKLPDYFPEEWS